MGEIVPSRNHNTAGVCNQITLLILYCISSRMLTLLKVVDDTIYVPNIFYPTLSLKLLKFYFPMCLFFVPEKSTSFMFYIVLYYPLCFGLDPVPTAF